MPWRCRQFFDQTLNRLHQGAPAHAFIRQAQKIEWLRQLAIEQNYHVLDYSPGQDCNRHERIETQSHNLCRFGSGNAPGPIFGPIRMAMQMIGPIGTAAAMKLDGQARTGHDYIMICRSENGKTFPTSVARPDSRTKHQTGLIKLAAKASL